jgi:uracil-DNA glycosylase family 4
MEAQPKPEQLLQWYAEIGVDEAIGDTPVDRTRIPEKAAILPIQKPPVPAMVPEAAPAPVTGTIEALKEAEALAAKAKTIEELRTTLESFQGLTLRRTATQMVFADGVPTARIMLVGEAPGADEDRTGVPFVGESGQLLDKMLAAINLSRTENVYITNLVNWRPPGNRNPSDEEIALSLPFVRRHIELINPAVLVCVGGVSAKALLQSPKTITHLRGKWIDYASPDLKQPLPSLAIFHPSYLLQMPTQKKLAWEDLQMLRTKLQELGII